MSRFSLWMLAIALAMFTHLAFANGSVCYGDLDGICRSPQLRVDQTATIDLPGNLFADGDESRMTLTVLLQNATFAVPPTVIGDSAIVCSSESSICVASDGPFALTGLRVSGAFGPGDAITARVVLTNPNTGVTLFDQPVVLATIGGVTEAELFMLNPQGNATQQTFMRVVNVDAIPATVRLRPIDDAGNVGGDVSLILAPNAAVQLNSADLESGNPDKGLTGAFGEGLGKRRVQLFANARVRAQMLVRNNNTGTLSALSDVTP